MIRWALLVVMSLTFLAGCGAGGGGPTEGRDFDDLGADKVVIKMRHYITNDGVRQALILADTAFFYDDGSPIELKGVELTLYGESGGVSATLTSETASLDPRTEALSARGNVVVISAEEGHQVESEELHYDPGLDRIWSDLPTKLTRDGKVTEGDGFRSDGRGLNVRVISPRGQIEPPPTMSS